MKRSNPLFLLLLLMPVFSLAQGNYKPGYVVHLNGDTVKGYIDYRQWNKNPKSIDFKTGLDSSSIVNTLTTGDIASFTITGSDRYKRFVLKISEDAINGFKVSNVINTKEITDTVFLKVLNSGKYVTLFSYTDKLKTRYFIDENGGHPAELGLHAYTDASSETKMTELYKRQLERLAVKYQPDNKLLINEIEETGYNAEGLSNIIFEINGSDKASTFIAGDNNRFRLFVGAGINILSVHNYSDDYYTDPSKNLSYQNHSSLVEEINFGEDLYLNKTSNKFILRGAFQIAYSSGNKINDIQTGALNLRYNTLTMSLNPQLLYNIYSDTGIDIYIDAGLELFLVGGTHITYMAPDFVYLNPPGYSAPDFSFTIKAEIDINKNFGFYIGYDPVSTIGQSTNTVSTFHLGINFLFGRSK